MRYCSKRYKKKISQLVKLAKKDDQPLYMLIGTLKALAKCKYNDRLERRNAGKYIVWKDAKIRQFTVSFPYETSNGKRYQFLSACFKLEQFYELEERYGKCPEDIAEKVVAALKK